MKTIVASSVAFDPRPPRSFPGGVAGGGQLAPINTMENPLKVIRPELSHLAVTGAALRSVQFADADADAYAATLQALAGNWWLVLQAPPDALGIAALISATSAINSHLETKTKLTPRHREIRLSGWQLYPNEKLAPGWPHAFPANAASDAAKSYRELLLNAGVPMPVEGSGTAQYWRDAAARGC